MSGKPKTTPKDVHITQSQQLESTAAIERRADDDEPPPLIIDDSPHSESDSLFSQPTYTAPTTTTSPKKDFLIPLAKKQPENSATVQPTETKSNPEDLEKTIQTTLAQIKSIESESDLLKIHVAIKQNFLADARIYNALIITAYNLKRVDLVHTLVAEAESSNATNHETYYTLIEIKARNKDKKSVMGYYQKLISQGAINVETYTKTIEALIRCKDMDGVWQIYEKEVPAIIKQSHWKIHEVVMSMVRCFNFPYTPANKHQIRWLLIIATTAYNNAINAKLDNYDAAHVKMLEIALTYDLLDLAYSIYRDAKDLKTTGPLTEAMYVKCKLRITAEYGSEENLEALLRKPVSISRSSNPPAERKSHPSAMTTQVTVMHVSPVQQHYANTRGGYTPTMYQPLERITPQHRQAYRSQQGQLPSSNTQVVYNRRHNLTGK